MNTVIRFGTDGWRGVIDDDFTEANVRVAACALALWLRSKGVADRGVVVGYDRRLKSPQFAAETAGVLQVLDIPVILSDSCCGSPAVSQAVHSRQAAAGVMITASHNPWRFNGFKIKASYGGSAGPEITSAVERKLNEAVSLAATLPHQLPQAPVQDINSLYLDGVRKLADIQAIQNQQGSVVYDAMHGSGAGYLPKLLDGGRLRVVPIRDTADHTFGGLNPEPIESNLDPLRQCLLGTADTLGGIAVDGDADRIGAMDAHGQFVDSHSLFAILLMHLVERRGLRGRVVKTVSTTRMIDHLCSHYGLPLTVTPIGFKWICDNMRQGDVLIGGEESGGIGVAGYIPERDGVAMGLLLLEALAMSGRSMEQLLQDVWSITGERRYARIDVHLPREAMPAAHELIASTQAQSIAGEHVARIDRLDGVKFELPSESWLLLRASGTEPVVRIYAEGPNQERVQELLEAGRALFSAG